MNKWILPLACLSALGCSNAYRAQQRTAADYVATAVNAADHTLADAELAEHRTCIERAEKRIDARICIAHVKDRYNPAWRQMKLVKATHDMWVTALTADKNDHILVTGARFHEAYCGLRAAAPASLKLPDVPGVPCSN